MNLLQTKSTITSLELVKQINIFRAKERENGSTDRLHADIAHKSLLDVIREEFSDEIGRNELVPSSYLNSQNKEQPMFELTLSQAKQVLVRESKIVRKAIIFYIEKLEQELEKPKPKTQIELIIESALVLQNHESRLSNLESKFIQLEDSKQEALVQLNYIERSTEEVPEIGTRLKINQIVRAYSEKTGIDYKDIWSSIYNKMLYVYHFNVNAYKKLHAKESKLDIVERINQLDNLFALVSKELL
jgi:hypothetical protein